MTWYGVVWYLQYGMVWLVVRDVLRYVVVWRRAWYAEVYRGTVRYAAIYHIEIRHDVSRYAVI